MKTFLYIFASTVALALDFVQICMFLCALLSWFPPANGEGGPIRRFLLAVTELVVAPVRAFLERFEWVRRSPIDLSFMITFLLLALVSTLLPQVRL